MFNLAGLLGGQQTPQQGGVQVDPNTGFNPGDQRAAAMGQMGQLGMTLLAAGQYMQPDQRARILANGAGYMGDTSASLHRMAQARQMTDSYQNAQIERARENAAIQSVLADPNVSPQDKAFASANPGAYLAAKFNRENRPPPEIEQKIAALKRLGMSDEEIRRTVAGGQGRFRHFAAGVVDTETGDIRPYRVVGADGQPVPQPTSDPGEEPVEGVPMNPNRVFGSEGAIGWLKRKGRGVLGTETTDDRALARDSAWLTGFKNTADDVLAETFDGRKTNYTIKRASIVAKPEELWSSPKEAQGHTQLIVQESKDRIAEIDRLLTDPRLTGNKTVYAKMKIKRGQLVEVQRKAEALLGNFGVQDSGGDPLAATDALVDNLLTPRK
jgi:hypothetical protein